MVTKYLIGICQTTHATHDTEDVIVGGIDTDLSSLGAFNCGVRQDQLKGGVINTREIARAAGLVFFRAQCKAVHVNTFIRVTCVGLVRLNPREVGTFALREAILAVQLEFSSDNRVHAPAMHVQRGFRQHECASIRDR